MLILIESIVLCILFTIMVYIMSKDPIKTLYNLNIPLSINTDNRTVSNITLTEEYLKLANYFHCFSLRIEI